MSVLLRILHVSDLHIGDPDDTGHAAVRKLWKAHPWFHGLFGHSHDALTDLEAVHASFLSKPEHHRLVVTGDITTYGGPTQFALADDFLGDLARFGSRPEIGLKVADWRDRAVPGNHDHWSGQPKVFGGPTRALADRFSLPEASPVVDLGRGRILRFLRIDSDADVDANSKRRLFARGHFTTQLDDLDDALARLDVSSHERLVLLVHHSLARPWWRAKLSVSWRSRRRLRHFLARHRVSVMLTGHTHAARLTRHPVGRAGRRHEVLEACCGTTTQSDHPWWSDEDASEPGPHQNTLLVHEIEEDEGGTVRWTSEAWGRWADGFEAGPLAPDGRPRKESIVLWPGAASGVGGS